MGKFLSFAILSNFLIFVANCSSWHATTPATQVGTPHPVEKPFRNSSNSNHSNSSNSTESKVGVNAKISEEIGQRNSKFFPFLFAVVLKVSNEKCEAEGDLVGQCYVESECTKLGGLASGPCANGLGTCCVFNAKCSDFSKIVTIQRNITYITNPDTRQPCRFLIPKQQGICQIRLDFKEFSLSDPMDGECVADTFTISGADNIGKFVLCGKSMIENHMYLHFGESESISLATNVLSEMSAHTIQVTMIPCDSVEKAPDACTQYFTGEFGQVHSFNFPHQLNRQMYMICVKTIPGSSEIMWAKCTPNSTSFAVSGDATDGRIPTALTGSSCARDYISILDSPEGRFCGTDFAGMKSKARPYLLWVNFDIEEIISPTGIFDPMSGCPVGWTCLPMLGGSPPCTELDECMPPTSVSNLIDTANTGFCLQYQVK